jgi:hypothetical protein
MRTFVLATLGLLPCACLGPNPWLITDGETDASGDGDSSGDDPTGDGDGDTTGDGDGDTTGDGDGDGDPCSNGNQDGDETDLDCGGSCMPCDPGAGCQNEGDCNSGVCDQGMCAAPSCGDDVLNGTELAIDCGGSCRFCEHSGLITEFDDFEASDALMPGVTMYDDGSFALLYVGLQSVELRLRWFDELAEPLGPGVQLTSAITMPIFGSHTVVAGELANHVAYAVMNGLEDGVSSSRDTFMVERGPDSAAQHWSIYQGPDVVSFADMVLDGDISTFVWQQNDKLWLRRRDFTLADNGFIDLPIEVDPASAQYNGLEPALARANDVTVVAWVRCPVANPDQCTIALRQFDDIWLDLGPVTLPSFAASLGSPQVAVAEDGRVAVAFVDEDANEVWAAMFDADLQLEAEPWLLQGNLPTGGFDPAPDTVALADGSFAFAWPDGNDNRVHIRRFIAANTPLVTNVGDEAPWPTTEDPFWVRLATANNLVVVTWSGKLDGVYQIQGQVLSY